MDDATRGAVDGGTVEVVVERPPAPRPVPADPAAVLARHHVTEAGDPDGPVLVLVHGFGAAQAAWSRLVPLLADHRLVLLDHLGSGATDVTAFDHDRHSRLSGYAEDLLDVCAALDLRGATVVGHSASSVVACLAAAADPRRLRSLVLLAPSARYVDDPATGYVGGFSGEDVQELLTSLDSNYYAWSAAMAPVVMHNPDVPELARELEASFLGTHPDAAATFARAIFCSDARAALPRVPLPTSVLQCRHDALAPPSAVRRVVDGLPHGRLVELRATGHCPHVSAPGEVAAAVREHLAGLPPLTAP